MAEGFTSSFDPVTGERKETKFQYEPVQAVDTMPSQSISPAQMAEVYKYFFTQTRNPSQAVEAANDYIDAARQFKGRMLYQQAARENRLTPEFQARLAEDMFARNAKDLATVRKSFMPERVPQITPYQRESLDLQKRRLDTPPAMTPYQAEQVRLREMALNKPPEPETMTISETLEATEATPEIPAVEFKQRGPGILDRLIPDRKAQAYQPAMPAQGRRTITRKVPVSGAPTTTGTLSEQAQAFQPTQKQLDRATATDILKQAGGDREKARKLAKELGYTF